MSERPPDIKLVPSHTIDDVLPIHLPEARTPEQLAYMIAVATRNQRTKVRRINLGKLEDAGYLFVPRHMRNQL